jgi:hypothetical protein
MSRETSISGEEEMKFRERLERAQMENSYEEYFSTLTPAERLEEFQILEQLIDNEEETVK